MILSGMKAYYGAPKNQQGEYIGVVLRNIDQILLPKEATDGTR